MSRLHYAAANVGERDLYVGMAHLQEWTRKTPLPLLSSNLVYQDSGDPVFLRTLVKTFPAGPPGGKKKLRVGVMGLTRMNAGLAATAPDGRSIVTVDPVTTAKSTVPELRKKSDLLVALVTLNLEESKELVSQVPGIDIVLGGFGALETSVATSQPPGGGPATRILYIGNQGKKVAETRVLLAEAAAAPVQLVSNVIALGTQVPDDPAIMDLVEKNRIAINEINKKEAPLVDPEKLRATWQGDSFVRSVACKTCHESEYKTWTESSHARAFHILEEKHQDYNPECVACHTTGFRQPTGFVNAKSTPDLMNVQCEACHGPGNRHPDTVGEGYGAVARDFCERCHTRENSPDFNDALYRVKIQHWTEKTGEHAASASR